MLPGPSRVALAHCGYQHQAVQGAGAGAGAGAGEEIISNETLYIRHLSRVECTAHGTESINHPESF
jgi:hypothetical protein